MITGKYTKHFPQKNDSDNQSTTQTINSTDISVRARAHWPLCSTTCGRALWRTRAH